VAVRTWPGRLRWDTVELHAVAEPALKAQTLSPSQRSWPRSEVVGSFGATRFELGTDRKPVLVKEAEAAFVNDGPGKPVANNLFIWRRPIFAFGNSDGDLPDAAMDCGRRRAAFHGPHPSHRRRTGMGL